MVVHILGPQQAVAECRICAFLRACSRLTSVPSPGHTKVQPLLAPESYARSFRGQQMSNKLASLNASLTCKPCDPTPLCLLGLVCLQGDVQQPFLFTLNSSILTAAHGERINAAVKRYESLNMPGPVCPFSVFLL